MKIQNYTALFISFCLAGCLANRATPAGTTRIDVFGVTLDSTTDYRVIRGVTASEEPCLRGYERSFDPLEIAIGYGHDGRVRKITTRNPGTSLFGISPGMSMVEGRRLASQAGFAAVSPDNYLGEHGRLLLRSGDNGTIAGITLENSD